MSRFGVAGFWLLLNVFSLGCQSTPRLGPRLGVAAYLTPDSNARAAAAIVDSVLRAERPQHDVLPWDALRMFVRDYAYTTSDTMSATDLRELAKVMHAELLFDLQWAGDASGGQLRAIAVSRSGVTAPTLTAKGRDVRSAGLRLAKQLMLVADSLARNIP
jgi:hypothetical protein